MGEGELKKRLQMLTSFSVPFVLSDEERIKVNEIIQQLERINNKETSRVVDEAKKDIPIFGIGNNSESAAIDGINKINKWLKKWFGDSS